MVAFITLLTASAVIILAIAAPALTSSVKISEEGPHVLILGSSNHLSRRSAINYDQDYTTGGTMDYSPSRTGFSVQWSHADDFVVGVGWTTGSTDPITFCGSFSISTGLLSVYGWATGPLVEYYVMENYANPPGTFTSDDSTYTVWKNTRVDDPSILGTSTFNQHISIRDTPRTSGTVTVENYFEKWAALGMTPGTFNYQVIDVEGWSGSGSAEQPVSNTGSTGTSNSPSTGGTVAG